MTAEAREVKPKMTELKKKVILKRKIAENNMYDKIDSRVHVETTLLSMMVARATE